MESRQFEETSVDGARKSDSARTSSASAPYSVQQQSQWIPPGVFSQVEQDSPALSKQHWSAKENSIGRSPGSECDCSRSSSSSSSSTSKPDEDIMSNSSRASSSTHNTTTQVVSSEVLVCPYRKGAVSRVAGMILTDLWFYVPLDYHKIGGLRIPLYVREVVAAGREKASLPYLVYLEGGPGSCAPRPTSKTGWLQRALEEYKVLLLDQRGTGSSYPLSAEALTQLLRLHHSVIAAPPGKAYSSMSEAVEYLLLSMDAVPDATRASEGVVDFPDSSVAFVTSLLANFRADSIVRDCEIVRRTLLGTSGLLRSRWTLLGQSFGGFIIATYLSIAPEAIEAAIFAGGLPPMGKSVDAVYRSTFKRVIDRNKRFYLQYPQHVTRVKEILHCLKTQKVRLPSGGLLTPRRFLQLGLNFGMATGFDYVHYMLESAFGTPFAQLLQLLVPEYMSQRSPLPHTDSPPKSQSSLPIRNASTDSATEADSDKPTSEAPDCQPSVLSSDTVRVVQTLSHHFLKALEHAQNFEVNPLYVLLHESIYCDGPGEASGWSAQRLIRDFTEFNWEDALTPHNSHPVTFTGEMVFPWMFEDYVKLRPLREVANALAWKTDWCALYNLKVLARSTVPCAAAVYYDDMYVDVKSSEDTAQMIPNVRIWVTNEYQHSGLRDDGYAILNKLLWMVRGGLTIPS